VDIFWNYTVTSSLVSVEAVNKRASPKITECNFSNNRVVKNGQQGKSPSAS